MLGSSLYSNTSDAGKQRGSDTGNSASSGHSCSSCCACALHGLKKSFRRASWNADDVPKESGAVRAAVTEQIALGPKASSISDITSLLLASDDTRCISESYQYVGPLGHGGFGNVFRAHNFQTGEDRAIKEIPLSGVQADMKFVHAELEAMIRLNHPNIVKLYEFFEDGDVLYLATEICSEGDFSHLNNGINNPVEIKRLFQDLMMAVAYCHDLGIAHRDLKFKNCLVQKPLGLRRVAKVIDFGLAAIRRPGDAADHWLTERLGSEYFVAPEVLDGSKNYGVKCDCWSVGVMLYVVLTDEHPFVERVDKLERSRLFRMIMHNKVRRGPLGAAEVDEIACDLISKLLVKDPEERLDSKSVLNHDWFTTAKQSLTWHSASNNDLQSMQFLRQWSFVLQTDKGQSAPLTRQMLSRIRAFADSTHFERALMTLAAHYAMSKDVEDLRATFEQLNTSKSGSLSREEFEEGVRSVGYALQEQDVEELVRALAAKQTGKIHYTKWLSATINPSLLATEKMIDQVYFYFDPKQKGKASSEELCRLLGGDATIDEVPNKNEFKALLRQVAKNLENRCADDLMNWEGRCPGDANSVADEDLTDHGVQAWLGVYGQL